MIDKVNGYLAVARGLKDRLGESAKDPEARLLRILPERPEFGLGHIARSEKATPLARVVHIEPAVGSVATRANGSLSASVRPARFERLSACYLKGCSRWRLRFSKRIQFRDFCR
jgi:hypothetical protein